MTLQDQIVQLLKNHDHLTISQIAQFLGKDLPQISKNIKKLVEKNVVKKMEYSYPGERSRKRIIQLVNPQLVDTTCQTTQVVHTTTPKKEELEKNHEESIEQLANPQLVDTTCQTTTQIVIPDAKKKGSIKESGFAQDIDMEQLVNLQLVGATCQTAQVNTIPEHIRILLQGILQTELSRCKNGKWTSLERQVRALADFFQLPL